MANRALALKHEEGGDLVALVALTEELTADILVENRLLAEGLPSPEGVTAKKAGIAMRIEALTRRLHADPDALAGSPEADKAAFDAASERLHAAMTENIARIQAAAAASGSRVVAFMAAMREKSATETGYGANGRVQTAPRHVASGRLA